MHVETELIDYFYNELLYGWLIHGTVHFHGLFTFCRQAKVY